jgi:hypothetical protein
MQEKIQNETKIITIIIGKQSLFSHNHLKRFCQICHPVFTSFDLAIFFTGDGNETNTHI